MSTTGPANGNEVDVQETRASTESGEHLGREAHDASLAGEAALTGEGVDTGEGRDKSHYGEIRDGDESEEPGPPFVEEHLWKTEKGIVSQSVQKPVVNE